jgi:hypothetical protein
MAQDDAVDVIEVFLENLGVVKEGIFVGTGVEDNSPRLSLRVLKLHDEGEPPLAQTPGLDEVLR